MDFLAISGCDTSL